MASPSTKICYVLYLEQSKLQNTNTMEISETMGGKFTVLAVTETYQTKAGKLRGCGVSSPVSDVQTRVVETRKAHKFS